MTGDVKVGEDTAMIRVRVQAKVYRRFRIRLLEENHSMAEVINELIEKWLKERASALLPTNGSVATDALAPAAKNL